MRARLAAIRRATLRRGLGLPLPPVWRATLRRGLGLPSPPVWRATRRRGLGLPLPPVWRATLRRGRLLSDSGRDRSTCIYYLIWVNWYATLGVRGQIPCKLRCITHALTRTAPGKACGDIRSDWHILAANRLLCDICSVDIRRLACGICSPEQSWPAGRNVPVACTA